MNKLDANATTRFIALNDSLTRHQLDVLTNQTKMLHSNRIIILQNAISQHYTLMTFDKNEDTLGFDYRIHPENKYISLKKRAKFIINILTLFISNLGFEIPNYCYKFRYDERGREEFRTSLCQYIHSITGTRPRLEYHESATNKYKIFEI